MWAAVERRPGLAASLVLHTLAAWWILRIPILTPAASARMRKTITIELVPRQGSDKHCGRCTLPGDGHPVPAGVDIDLRGIQVSIADDPDHEMMAVLRRQRGLLVFLVSAGSGRRVHSAFHAVGGEYHGRIDLDAFLIVYVNEPDLWPEVTRLRPARMLAGQILVCAAFPAGFQEIVKDEVREKAIEQGKRGRVTKTLIAFDATRKSGVRVLQVESNQ